MPTDLLPCPFCGGVNVREEGRVFRAIVCQGCYARGPDLRFERDPSPAAAEWNKRSDQAIKTMCTEWEFDHSLLQELCREAGCPEKEVTGDGCWNPGIRDLLELLRKQISSLCL